MRENRTSGLMWRGRETESRQAGLRRWRESASNRHRKPKATAPALDPTTFRRLASFLTGMQTRSPLALDLGHADCRATSIACSRRPDG